MRLPWRRLRKPLLAGSACALILAVLAAIHVSGRLAGGFEARERETTSRLLGRSFSLEAGTPGTRDGLLQRLRRLGYERVQGKPERPGTYALSPGTVDLHVRPFRDPAGEHEARRVRVSFARDRIAWVDRAGARLEPATLALFHGNEMEEREPVEIEDCPDHLLAAVIAAEDRRFYLHPGIDLRGIARALREDIASGSLSQGGSTITQQLAKNLYFTDERSWIRKGMEAVASLLLELRYDKKRILRAYINEIYLGQRGPVSIRGVGSAARHWFGKDLSELSLAESALLAGMIQSPGRYDPYSSPERATERRRLILRAMEQSGSITTEERFAAEREPLPTRRPVRRAPHRLGAYVADLLRSDLKAAHGEEFRSQDLRIHTSIDPLLQEAAEEAVREGLEDLERRHRRLRRGDEGKPLQAALISIDLADGGIVSLVGGRGFSSSQFNRATSARRQPGSLFKPIVYLAGLTHPGDGEGEDESDPGDRRRPGRRGWIGDENLVRRHDGEGDRLIPAVRKKKKRWRWFSSPDRSEPDLLGEEEENGAREEPRLPLTAATILLDEPYELVSGGRRWAPRNWDKSFRGPVTVQQALEESLNVPTARAAAAIGIPRILEMARQLGIDSDMPEVPSLALGTASLTPLEMARAFATIASGGEQREPWLLHGVTNRAAVLHRAGFASPDPSGSSSPRRWDRTGKSKRVLPRDAASVMTALLEGVTYRGTARSLRRLGYEGVAAGKTGTSDGGRDLWFCGFTPRILTLVWVGFDDNHPTGLSGARAALPIWVDYMKRIGAETDLQFPGDGDLIWTPIDPATGQIARRRCPETRWAPFIPGTEPVHRCRAHRSFRWWWED